MASGAELKQFYKQVIEPLFQGDPRYPYSVIYEDWAHYKSFLSAAGVPEFKIPASTDSPRRRATHVQVEEIDFLIQVIVAEVLRQIGTLIGPATGRRLEDTEAEAVKVFLTLADRYFPIGSDSSAQHAEIYAADRFEKLKDKIEGEHAQILNWACQRLNFFYKTQVQKERRRQAPPAARVAAESAPAEIRLQDEESPATGVVLKEEYVDRLYDAVSQHPLLQEMVEEVNRKHKDPDRKLGIELDNEGKGVFSVGRTQVDLRSILARIFVAIKPEAELLLSFLISKIQPDKVNLIELHYEKGLAEFEVAMKFEEGGISKQVHGAINECTAKANFPKIVVVCAAILEEVLGAKVNISFNRRGEVIVELPEIRERNSKNLAVALRRKLEDAIHREERANIEKPDPIYEDLRSIGARFEKEACSSPPRNDVYLPDKYDQMLDADLMRAAQEIQRQETGAATPYKPDKQKKFVDLEEQFRQYQNEIAASQGAYRKEPSATDNDGPKPAEPGSGPVPSQPTERRAKADEDNVKLRKLEESFRRTKPTQDVQRFTDALLSNRDAPSEEDQSPQDSAAIPGNKSFRTAIEDRPLVLETRTAMYRAPRDVTMAILSGVRAKNLELSKYDERSKKVSDTQLIQDFLDVLDEIALECCGSHLETLFPELLDADNFFEIARKLNEISDRQQFRNSRNESVEILLSGAIMASSSIQLTN